MEIVCSTCSELASGFLVMSRRMSEHWTAIIDSFQSIELVDHMRRHIQFGSKQHVRRFDDKECDPIRRKKLFVS